MALFAPVAHESFIIDAAQVLSDTAVRAHSESFEILLLRDPLVEHVDLEVLCLYFKPVVEIIVEAICFRIEEREDRWLAHEVEEVLKEHRVCVKEVCAITLRDPVVTRRKVQLEVPRIGDQSTSRDFEQTTGNIKCEDGWALRLSGYSGFLEGHLLFP